MEFENKKQLSTKILFVILIFLIISLAFFGGYKISQKQIERYCKSFETQNNSIVFKGLTDNILEFDCYWVSREGVDHIAVSPEDCLKVMLDTQKKWGVLLTFYDMKFNFKVDSSDENPTSIIFEDCSFGSYKTVTIDSSKNFLGYMSCVSYYSEYDMFDKYVILGPMCLAGKEENLNEIDSTFLSQACENGVIVVDEYTYNTYAYSSVLVEGKGINKMKDVLDLFDSSHVKVVPNMREYTADAIA